MKYIECKTECQKNQPHMYHNIQHLNTVSFVMSTVFNYIKHISKFETEFLIINSSLTIV